MQNQVELEAISVRLYKYLCEEVVGSENIVRYRRLYYKLHDDISTDIHFEFISSGSKAEGLDLPSSDFDWMVLNKLWKVYEDQPRDKEDVLILDTENALPGFALLKKVAGSSFPVSPTITADGNLISTSDFLNMTWELRQKGYQGEIHGPCLSNTFIVDLDVLICFKCDTWPTVAKRWLLRCRPSNWPSHRNISKIVSQGCLIVPVGSKTSGSDGNPLEWRFSFSLAEKLLVHSFNHTQLLCYALLKIWLKEVLNSDDILNNKLCSYFMKTVLFWILEEGENLNWTPPFLLHCFFLCIRRLHYWIVCGYFPSYFIPEHNMIDGKLTQNDLAYLSLTLDKMNMREIWKVMFSVPSLRNFCKFSMGLQRKPNRLSEFDKTVLSLQTSSSLMMDTLHGWRNNSVSACVIYRMIQKRLPKSARKILSLMFLQENQNILASLHFDNLSNKLGYLGYKECISRILLNTFYKADSGWLLLAALFYSTQKYQEMSRVLQLSSSILSFKNRFVQTNVSIQSFRDMSKVTKIVYSRSFIKRMKFESSRVFYVDFKGLRTENYPFLSEKIPRVVGGLPSQSLFFFLKFLYSQKQGDLLGTQSALLSLKAIFKEESKTSLNFLCLISFYAPLQKAYELSNDKIGALVCHVSFYKALKMSDEFETLVPYLPDDDFVKMILDIV